MILVFDTSALSALLSGDDRVVRVATKPQYDRQVVPLATDAEIRFGFANGTREVQNIQSYELYKQQFDVRIIFPDQDTAVLYADLAKWAKHQGVALFNNDIWIAATCMQIGGKLITLDEDFSHLPQVHLEYVK